MQIDRLSPSGFILTDVFGTDLLNEIRTACETFEPTQIQTSGTSAREAYFLTQGDLRQKIINAVIAIIQTVTDNPKIRGVELWRDYPEYINPYHYDDPIVQNVMIVYLGDEELTAGTGYTEEHNFIVPYKKNTGIMLLNSDKIYHGMIGSVPANVVRKTLYINWLK
jgi:hypothetical protein